ncbi:hypothetical protein NDU88_008561 [Pleurodeles waltl]|uniref:Uncharacterized protein n=1 Tax=Pleurodeles waltl TaxID=8319 RepID=A0AAV7RTK7_PLEWA|nr:hypothetical protein NDU88_008561 [Pleurodeles waltl]
MQPELLQEPRGPAWGPCTSKEERDVSHCNPDLSGRLTFQQERRDSLRLEANPEAGSPERKERRGELHCTADRCEICRLIRPD